MNRKFSLAELLPIALVLQLVSMTALLAAPTETGPVRVGLTRFSGARQVSVLASSSYSVFGTTTGERLAQSSNLVPIIFEVRGTEITLKRDKGEPVGVGASATVKPDDSAAVVTVDSQGNTGQYRGSIEINLTSGAIRIVNVVGLEDYLLGVVPAEMPQSYPMEALKAQAIAARTYALRNRRKHKSDGFDVCDGQHCQAYGGSLVERATTTRAVTETRGLVLTHNSEIAHVMYSADCGGATENYAAVRSLADCPYLCGVNEPAEVVHRCWEKSFALADLSAALVRGGIKEAEGLTGMCVTESSPSGRALRVEARGSKSAQIVTGERVRAILDLDSTLYTIEKTAPDTVIFRGKGWGHGVGLCQTGAKALAAPPLSYTYDRILAHYFPGAVLASLGGEAVPVAKSEVDAVWIAPAPPPEPKAPVSNPPPPAREKNDPSNLNLRLEEPHF